MIVLTTAFSIIERRYIFMWPIIAFSCFHIILSLYFLLIFSYFYFFKPLYIIMVLNWVFDTFHTTKTTSYYVHCFVISMSTISFGLFNLWQLWISQNFQNYVRLHFELRNLSTDITNEKSIKNANLVV
ncbi:unnamed protein product [Dracunculus medinensis]|uniref:TLC domain-containing protein n=1 Tax=Dracunculus medinensis TaxID=318479 RepID=A0A0N4UEW9_DRAME|nr:unnamed protein product [Dracunculus medinensis]